MDTAIVDLGRVRGLALLKGKGPRFRHIVADQYFVPSATSSGGYVADLSADTCGCQAFEDTGIFCKHLWAASFFRDGAPTPVDEAIVPEAVRPTYVQAWPAYNRAQCEEKERVQILLRSLCDGIEQPKQGMGRPRFPLRDAVYGATMKVYGTMSGRRSTTDLRACGAAGHLDQVPAYNTVFKYMEQPGLTPLLEKLVDESARPLAAVETTLAPDATGFATQTYVRWMDVKYGAKQVRRVIKAHAMAGTLTNIITAVVVTEGTVNDSPMLGELLERTVASGFDVREVCADKAYLSHANLSMIEKVGAQPFIPFKSNSGSSGSDAWERMYHLYSLNRETFLTHYHKRSRVEVQPSARLQAQVRACGAIEAPDCAVQRGLLKCLCHNLSRCSCTRSTSSASSRASGFRER